MQTNSAQAGAIRAAAAATAAARLLQRRYDGQRAGCGGRTRRQYDGRVLRPRRAATTAALRQCGGSAAESGAYQVRVVGGAQLLRRHPGTVNTNRGARTSYELS